MNTPQNKIKQYREAKGMSIGQLAAKVGVCYQTVSGWEDGYSQPRVFNAICLAQALGTTVEELFSP